ncbi:E3 ubiquitin-protein ligase RHA2A-like [Cornus florida]|uniref:E3 ubiquitin-protein ligase RHA2A-like n=1 Tax=Cornus florida TaxID=4283 RepID=UPI0028A02B57|nr:E3 ubiquitin-protein ligase RHA2A-like [Cornus florida]
MSILATFFTIIPILFLISYIKSRHNLLIPKFNLHSVVMNYVILPLTHFNSGWNFLFQHSNFWHTECDRVPKNGEDLGVKLYEGRGSGGAVECAVCLCEIEEGDEIRELKCAHLFHRVCLDRWVEYRHITCPLCRDSLRSRRCVDEVGEEVLLFKFCSFRSSDRNLWWLR